MLRITLHLLGRGPGTLLPPIFADLLLFRIVPLQHPTRMYILANNIL
jgi:hypothetical protein